MCALIPTREIRIENSTVCNYHCLMCPREAFSRRRECMSTELFAKIAAHAKDELPQLEMCTVSGYGEFAADPGWREKLAAARKLYDKIHVVTNLSLVEGADLDLLASLATEVRVSIGAIDDRTYTAVHRPPAGIGFAVIEKRVHELARLRRPGFALRLTCCVLDENQSQIPAWIGRWGDVADGLEVWRPHNWVRAKAYRSIDEPRMDSCGRPANGPIQVQVDGTLTVCCFDHNGEMVIGDLKRQRLTEIYRGGKLARIREQHDSGHADDLPLCSVCDQRERPERRARNMVYCSFADPADRAQRTSSGNELLRSAKTTAEGT